MNTLTQMDMVLLYFCLSDLKGHHSVNQDFQTEVNFKNYHLNNTFHRTAFMTGHLFIQPGPNPDEITNRLPVWALEKVHDSCISLFLKL